MSRTKGNEPSARRVLGLSHRDHVGGRPRLPAVPERAQGRLHVRHPPTEGNLADSDGEVGGVGREPGDDVPVRATSVRTSSGPESTPSARRMRQWRCPCASARLSRRPAAEAGGVRWMPLSVSSFSRWARSTPSKLPNASSSAAAMSRPSVPPARRRWPTSAGSRWPRRGRPGRRSPDRSGPARCPTSCGSRTARWSAGPDRGRSRAAGSTAGGRPRREGGRRPRRRRTGSPGSGSWRAR